MQTQPMQQQTQPMQQQTQPLGQPAASCEQCGSPLAVDQRYCLNCGKRRGGPRVDYRQQMLAAPASSPEPPRPVADSESKQPEKGERDYAPLAAVGGIALLGLMLLVGVLIGKGDGGTATAPAPVVVKGGGEVESSGGEAGVEGKGSGGSGLGTSGGGKSKGGEKTSGGETASGETASGEGAVQADKKELEEIASETGEEAAKNALKLPDKIATPGKPPPIDKSKPPGGGGENATVIK
jgi:hypothetical protein